MVEQQGWKQCVVAMGMLGLAAGASGCANAYAQSTPDSGSSATEASDASAAAASTATDSGTAAASGDSGTSGTTASAAAYTGPEPWFNLRNNPQQLHIGAGIATPLIVRIEHRNHAAIVDCYKAQLASDARLHGVLSVRLQVIAGGFGTIDRVRFAPRNEAMERCVQRVFQAVTWPNPRGVPATQIEMEFDLAPTPPPPAPRH